VTNDDIRRFLLAHRKIMPDVELAKIAGCSAANIGQYINRRGGRTDGETYLHVNKIHKALGLKVERKYVPEEVAWSQGAPLPRRVEVWTLARPRPPRR
jgi:hypothetical protein